MKNLIIALFLFLPFLAVSQTQSFVSNGSIVGKKFDKRIILVSVNWDICVLSVAGVPASFVIESKEKDVQTGEILSFCVLDNGQRFTLISDTEGVRGLYCPRTEKRYDAEIGDIWAEMQNSK